MGRPRASRTVLVVFGLVSVASSLAAADDTTLQLTATNDLSAPAGFIRIPVSPSATGLHDLVVIGLPPLCPAPSYGIDVDNDLLTVFWSCDCVQPNQSFEFSIQAPQGTALGDPDWFGGSPFSECEGVVLDRPRVADLNGDRDGFPDTNETFDLSLTLTNHWDTNLTNAVAHLSTADPKVDCISIPSVNLGVFASGATMQLPAPFRLHVAPGADRAGTVPPVSCNAGVCSNGAGGCSTAANCQRTVDDDYLASVVVTVTADQMPAGQALAPIPVDLDLDSATAVAGTATFMEGFEAGFGNFTLMNLDVNRATNALSDGYRCQYSDPDFPNSNSYGQTECYLGWPSGQPLNNDWHVHATTAPDAGHAYQGTRSLHYGMHTGGVPARDTYGFSQMDAVRTKVLLRLAARVCRDDPSPSQRSCAVDADCVVTGGGPCVAAAPELSFKHQVATTADCALGDRQAADRAIVAAKIVTAADWRKIEPYRNVYDYFAHFELSNCGFDPVDDGNDEDDYFDPSDPQRRYGPSSSCFPEKVFSVIGNTNLPFNAANTGHADGPGLAGSLGQGTWVESKFDLSRYRGRTIQLRWLFTTMQLGTSVTTWDSLSGSNGAWGGCDDGWYVDDVQVTQTLGAEPVVSADTKDNSALPGNADCDAAPDASDCAPNDPTAFALPEVTGVRFSDDTSVTWTSAIPAAGSGTVHDVARGSLAELPVGSGGSEACLLPGSPAASATDSSSPVGGLWYLVRARNSCGTGSYGTTSASVPRASAACP